MKSQDAILNHSHSSMDEHKNHEDLIKNIENQLRPILDSSKQAIYVYLDDNQKICNENFAQLLGYSSAQDWAQTSGPFADTFVEPKSQNTLVSAYQDAMEEMVGSKISVTWTKKNGGSVETSVILVPFSYDDHLYAVHYVSKI